MHSVLTHVESCADLQKDVSADVEMSTVDGRAELWSDLRLGQSKLLFFQPACWGRPDWTF
jgi:hypothetical protein